MRVKLTVNYKIQAIKVVRTFAKCGLKEGKDLVDAIEASGGYMDIASKEELDRFLAVNADAWHQNLLSKYKNLMEDLSFMLACLKDNNSEYVKMRLGRILENEKKENLLPFTFCGEEIYTAVPNISALNSY